MYSIAGYGSMITDAVRTDAYLKALRAAITPGCVVVDIGTGTGFFALMARQLGARRVFAIEPDDVIEVARKMAAANGSASSIDFIQAMSTEISLPEKADVVVSDLRGVLPFFGQHLPSIADARARFLAPGGVLIPGSDTIWAACVEAPELHRSITSPWSDNVYGLDMRCASELQSNRWQRSDLKEAQLMCRPERCATIDYTTVTTPNLQGTASLTVSRTGNSHGVGVWFDSTLSEGIHFSNAPGKPQTIYGQAFFPWPKPVELDAADSISLDLQCHLVGSDYVWSWDTCIRRKRHEAAIHFKQSEFFSQPLSPHKLRKQSATYIPKLDEEGQIDWLILSLMREGHSLGDIASRLESAYPARFTRPRDALTRAARLCLAYSS